MLISLVASALRWHPVSATLVLIVLTIGGCLAGLAAQAQAAVEPGALLVGLGTWPIMALEAVDGALARMGLLFTVAAGSALVIPAWAWGERFTRGVGRLVGALFVAIVGLELVGGGLVVWGVGLLTAWAPGPGVRILLTWETPRLALRG